MMLVFGRRDFLLGAIAFAAVFSHMSIDTIIAYTSGEFPLFIPFSDYITSFQGTDWIILQLVAIIAVVIAKLVTEKKRIKQKLFKEN